ncbi:MAG TPA: hypothetical protein VF801_11595 [Rhodocyclaceae bacterium]
MTPNISIVRVPSECPAEASAKSGLADPAAEASPLPAWWLGSRETFARLVDIRIRIHDRERAATKKAQTVLGGVLLVAVSVYSIDAISAMGVPAEPGFLAVFAALAVSGILLWLLDRRLLQQLRDIDLRSMLWLDLIDAVKHGRIDVPALSVEAEDESDVERLLRKEAAIAARFLTSSNTLAPHLPIFGHCFTLENS